MITEKFVHHRSHRLQCNIDILTLCRLSSGMLLLREFWVKHSPVCLHLVSVSSDSLVLSSCVLTNGNNVFCHSAENKRRTKHAQKSLNPEWNQTVIYKNIHLEQVWRCLDVHIVPLLESRCTGVQLSWGGGRFKQTLEGGDGSSKPYFYYVATYLHCLIYHFSSKGRGW